MNEHLPSNLSTPDKPESYYCDHRLAGKYTTLAVATLASGCRGVTHKDRLEDAVNLLVAAEENSSFVNHKFNSLREEHLKILDKAEREKASGLVKRTSLVLDICRHRGHDWQEETANERYRKWLEDDWEIHKDFLEHTGQRIDSFDAYLELWETGTKTKVFRSDNLALEIIERFSSWLEDVANMAPISTGSKVRARAKKTKKFVSKTDKGAGRTDNGTYGNG
jgi:Zn-dependent M32 family carboxypeptidase